MTAIAKALSRGFPGAQLVAEVLKPLSPFCGAGLLVSLIPKVYGLDVIASSRRPTPIPHRPGAALVSTPVGNLNLKLATVTHT
jgi:hypothetical protein